MSPSCTTPVSFAELVGYWALDLPEHELARVEEHLFGCARCSAESARVAEITETLRAMVPVLLSPDAELALRARGVRISENPMTPGERREVPFPDADILLHRLAGLELRDARRVSFTLRVEGSNDVMFKHPDAPFDREGGAVLVACQRHFSSFPPDTVAEVRVLDESGRERVTSYTILHRY